MIRNYLKTALRNIVRRRLFATVNISGLAVGIAAALVLTLFAKHELSFDKFHDRAEDIYLVYKERITPDGIQPAYDTWVPMLEQMQLDFPEITDGTRFFNDNVEVSIAGKRFNDLAAYVDTTFFDVFNFPLASGNNADPFPTLNSVIITRALATKYFADLDPIGKELSINFETSYIVSGILDEVPTTSSINFDLALPIISHPNYEQVAKNWGGSFLNTYIVLDDEATVEGLESKFPGFIEKIWDEETRNRTNFKLLPMLESYDTFIGDSQDSYILIGIALGILLIASINFMNLATASSMERSREIGVRKVLGSRRAQLSIQFILESVLITLFALVVALVMAKTTIPWLNEQFDMKMVLDLSDVRIVFGLIGFAVFIGLISGIYPAVFISGFNIIDSLKGSFQSGGETLRKGLVVFQFALSILLIAGALVVWSQINFMKNTDLAFNKDHLLIVPISVGDFEDRDEGAIRLQSFRDELMTSSNIISVSTSTHVPSQWSGSNTFVRPEGWEGDPLRMRFTYHDAEFFDTYEIKLVEGAGFLGDAKGNQRESVVLNRAAMDAFGFDNIHEKAIMLGNSRIQVVGVIDNFNFETLRSEVNPILHFHRIPSNSVHQYITLRINPENYSATINLLQEKWEVMNSGSPLEYFFMDESLAEMYATEDRLLRMVTAFSLISIFIAGLGLFGLSSFMIEKRKKEIGVRKVLGASLVQVVYSISKNYLLLIGIAFILSVPLSYYLMGFWLEDFANTITIGWEIYLLALGFTFLIGWGSISYKTLQAATLNPVHTLKEE